MVYRKPKFDLNKNPADFSSNDEFNKDNQFDDTALRLECVGHGTISQQDTKRARDHGCRLVIGLGRTASVCFNDRDSDLRLSLSHCSTTSKSDLSPVSGHQSASVEVSNGFGFGFHHVVDEGSTSATRSGGYMPSLLLAPRISVPLQKLRISELEPSVVSDFSTETASDRRISSNKCEFSGCANRQAEYCIEHGCGVRCSQSTGCSKAARGKSGLCIKHGGGKRHVEPGCTKSACGRTNCGVKHGGGKRYKFENPTTNTHGSTDICKTHAGVRQCVCDGEGKYEEFARRRGGLCFAHGSMVKETKEDKNRFLCSTPRLLHGFFSSPGPGSPDNHSLSCSSAVSSSTSWLPNPSFRRQLIPPQVLVPSSMKASSFLQFTRQSRSGTNNNGGQKSLGLVVPEGRVHGGSLLSLLGRILSDTDNDNDTDTDGI